LFAACAIFFLLFPSLSSWRLPASARIAFAILAALVILLGVTSFIQVLPSYRETEMQSIVINLDSVRQKIVPIIKMPAQEVFLVKYGCCRARHGGLYYRASQ
jgi:hypothetical protein